MDDEPHQLTWDKEDSMDIFHEDENIEKIRIPKKKNIQILEIIIKKGKNCIHYKIK